MPLSHNILRSRTILGSAKEITQLPWADGAEQLKFHAQNDKTKIYSLVVEYDPESGCYELCTQWRHADGYGGDVLQQRDIDDVLRQNQADKERAEAKNEADAIGGDQEEWF